MHGKRPESRAFILTLAYDRTTGERVVVEPETSVAAQGELLAARGLAVSESTQLTLESIADLPVVSVEREGCSIFNAAFAVAPRGRGHSAGGARRSSAARGSAAVTRGRPRRARRARGASPCGSPGSAAVTLEHGSERAAKAA